MRRTTLSTFAAISVSAVAASADANFWRYSLTSTNPWTTSLTAEFDPVSHRFRWEFTATNNTNGYWLCVSPGQNPQGNPGEFAAIYFDASNLGEDMTVTPKVTVYGYSAVGLNSWNDGSNAAGIQTPDRIFSSLDPASASAITALSATDSGSTRTFVLEMDASVIQEHTPLYPAANGDPWTGVGFGSLIGHWFHPVTGFNGTYGTDPTAANYNYLTSWSYTQWGFGDLANRPTQWVIPAPGALALLGVAGLVGPRRRRRVG
jgi:hypothetical protein